MTRFALAVVLVLPAASCRREGVPSENRRTVSFVVGGTPTRASVTPHEGDVASLDVLVFRSGDGLLEASNRVVAAGSELLTGISAEVSGGVALDWWVVANAPQGVLSSYGTEEAFLSGLTFLTHSTMASLVMYAGGSLPGGASAESVQVALDRYACKVSVGEVCVEWADAFSMAPVVKLGRIALINVVGSTPWSGVPAAGDLWYNRMGIEEREYVPVGDANMPSLVYDMLVKEYGVALEQGVPVDADSPLYCMPNPVFNNVNSVTSPQWSPRNTRVAVEVLVGDSPNWYPVDLPSMGCNTHYRINRLTVKGPGSPGPDYPVERDDVRYTVSVVPWTDVDLVPQYE